MINGLGVLGWGVGGIEAEAVMLGQPIYMLFAASGRRQTDGRIAHRDDGYGLGADVVQMLRAHGVVGKFVEFYGPGVSQLSLADRATLANMARNTGRRWAFSPVDEETLAYLVLTGRKKAVVERGPRLYEAHGHALPRRIP